MIRGFFLIVLLLSGGSLIFAQTGSQNESGPTKIINQQNRELSQRQEERRKEENLIEKSFRDLRDLENKTSPALLPNRRSLPEPQLSAAQKLLITPLPEDLDKYADFLKKPKTGIFKILPNLCGDGRVVNAADPNCLEPESDQLASYSFRRNLYGAKDWLDIQYQDARFRVGVKSLTIGMIAALGDVSPDQFDKDSGAVKSLLASPMPKKEGEISLRKKEIEKGIEIGALKFFNSLEAVPGTTYLLRSYAYRNKAAAVNDKRVDIIVVMKVVGIDSNHGLTVIWKELYRGNSNQI